MDIKTIKFMSEYNQIVNTKMNNIISELSDEQWNRAFGGYFRSIRQLCNHIYVCDYNWLKRFSALREFMYVKGTEINKGIEFGTTVLQNIKDYISKRKWLDEKINEFTNEITGSDITSVLKYIDSHGITYERNFGGLVLHMFNHETHHRGMVSIYLEELGIVNDYSNIYDIL